MTLSILVSKSITVQMASQTFRHSRTSKLTSPGQMYQTYIVSLR